MEDKIIELLNRDRIDFDEIKKIFSEELATLIKLSPDVKLVKNIINNINTSLELILEDFQATLKAKESLDNDLESKTDEFDDLEDTLEDLQRDFDNLESKHDDLKDKQIGSISNNLYDDQKIEILQELYLKCKLNTLEKILDENR